MLEKLISNPLANWTIGIVITLGLASLAAAGMNTLLVARLLLGIAVVAIGVALFLTSAGRQLRLPHRLAYFTAALIVAFAIERWETASQAPPPAKLVMPQPPLRLLLPPEMPFWRHFPTVLKEQQVAVDYVAFPSGGYASFTIDNAKDDVMLGIEGFRIANLSDRPMRLNWTLRLTGEGTRLEIPGTGRGRWERHLNRSDFTAQKGPVLHWLLAPANLPAGGRLVGPLGFVLPDADAPLRRLITEREIDARYKADLVIRDAISGREFMLKLPFGTKPVPDPAFEKRLEDTLRTERPSER